MTNKDKFTELVETGVVNIGINDRKLAVYREMAGISTWKELADACGLTMQTVKQVRLGKTNFTVETWMRLAFGVGCNPMDLLDVTWPGQGGASGPTVQP